MAGNHTRGVAAVSGTGRPTDEIKRDIERDLFMTAGEARDYGLIDSILAPQRGVSAEVLEAAGRV